MPIVEVDQGRVIEQPRINLTMRDFIFGSLYEYLGQKENTTVIFRDELEKFVDNYNDTQNLKGQERFDIEKLSSYFNERFGDRGTVLPYPQIDFFTKIWVTLERYKKDYQIVFLSQREKGSVFSVAETAFLKFLGRSGGMNLSECIAFQKEENINLEFSKAMIDRFLYIGVVEYEGDSGKFKLGV